MNLKDYDSVRIPDNINEYIEKGIEKGINYKVNNKNNIIKKSSLISAASLICLITASNIPVFANELVNIPIIGEIVKVLDFTNSIEFGGVITDGNNIIIDSLSNDTINIYFNKDGELSNDTPYYEIEYRQYPNTIVLTFSGVRGYNDKMIEDKLMSLPFIKDIYNIIVLDDSMRKIAIELDKSTALKATEHKNPAMIVLKANNNKSENIHREAYFVRSNEYEYGEQIALLEELLYEYEEKNIQKVGNGKFIIQFGPFDSKEIAQDKLNELLNDKGIQDKFYIELRELGEGPKY